MTEISSLKIPAPPAGKSTQATPVEEFPQIKTAVPTSDATAEKAAEKVLPREPVDPLNRAAKILEAHFASISGSRKKLTLERDEAAGVVVYRAVDRDTGEVIKQYPPDSLLKLLSYYRSVEGLSFNGLV